MRTEKENSNIWINAVDMAFKHSSSRKWLMICGENTFVGLKQPSDQYVFLNMLAKAIESTGWQFHEILGDTIWNLNIYDDRIDVYLKDLADKLHEYRYSSMKLLPILDQFGFWSQL